MTQVSLQGADVMQSGPVTLETEAASSPGRSSGLSRRVSALRAVPHLGTWVGIGVGVVGVVLLVVAWGKTAGEVVVGLQMPYLISAGFTGLGLVVLGLTIVNIEAKRADARERSAQMAELRGLLRELREAVEAAQR